MGVFMKNNGSLKERYDNKYLKEYLRLKEKNDKIKEKNITKIISYLEKTGILTDEFKNSKFYTDNALEIIYLTLFDKYEYSTITKIFGVDDPEFIDQVDNSFDYKKDLYTLQYNEISDKNHNSIDFYFPGFHARYNGQILRIDDDYYNSIRFYFDDNKLMIKKFKMYTGDEIYAMIARKYNMDSLMKFAHNYKNNPSREYFDKYYRIVEDYNDLHELEEVKKVRFFNELLANYGKLEEYNNSNFGPQENNCNYQGIINYIYNDIMGITEKLVVMGDTIEFDEICKKEGKSYLMYPYSYITDEHDRKMMDLDKLGFKITNNTFLITDGNITYQYEIDENYRLLVNNNIVYGKKVATEEEIINAMHNMYDGLAMYRKRREQDSFESYELAKTMRIGIGVSHKNKR
jgi:hypothetical protein